MLTLEFAVADEDSYADHDQTLPASEILSPLSAITNEPQTEPQLQPPLSEYESLTVQLVETPRNPEGWRRLVQLAEDSGCTEKISQAYEALLKQYPNNATAQIQYITTCINGHAFHKVEELFNRFLVRSPCVELWCFYLICVRSLNSAPSQREAVRMAYEFALSHVGQDKDSGQIWSDYIQFLQSGEAVTTWDQQQKMDSLRKVYQRAVQIPLDNVERLWQDLEAFEMNFNKITAKKFMADLSPAHMQARAVLRVLVNHIGPLYPPGHQLYLPSLPRFDASERALVGKWKAYLKWEESNPLELDEKDKNTLVTRILGVYRKAVIRMRYYTEIWFMAYTWSYSVGKPDEALSLLKAGLEANPTSFLLTFAFAEALEIKKEIAEVHTLYGRFLGLLRTNLEQLEHTANLNSNSTSFSRLINNGDSQSCLNTQISSDEKPHGKTPEVQKHRTEYGLAWIMYMRFGMRAEGVKGSRTIFGKGRRDRWAPWEIYEAAALMEYHCSDDRGVASRIFEKGMDGFGDEIEFVLCYLRFLIAINDKINARALFERVMPTFASERARPLWECWARYEYQYGDLEAALKLEKRMADVYISDPPIKRLAQRHIYLGTDAIADRDLGFAIARRAPSSLNNSLGHTETSQSLLGGSQTLNNSKNSSYGKRPASSEHRTTKRGRDDGYTAARPSPLPPTHGRGGRDRERKRNGGRWESRLSGARRRFSPGPRPPPGWDSERDENNIRGPGTGESGRARESLHSPRGQGQDRDDDTNTKRQVLLPNVVSWFMGELPAPVSFDGPVFRPDNLMNLFQNAVIPSSSNSRLKSPPPATPRSSGGRPSPDYGPYKGLVGGCGRRY